MVYGPKDKTNYLGFYSLRRAAVISLPLLVLGACASSRDLEYRVNTNTGTETLYQEKTYTLKYKERSFPERVRRYIFLGYVVLPFLEELKRRLNQ